MVQLSKPRLLHPWRRLSFTQLGRSVDSNTRPGTDVHASQPNRWSASLSQRGTIDERSSLGRWHWPVVVCWDSKLGQGLDGEHERGEDRQNTMSIPRRRT